MRQMATYPRILVEGGDFMCESDKYFGLEGAMKTEFEDRALEDLETIASRPIGTNLLKMISSICVRKNLTVYIRCAAGELYDEDRRGFPTKQAFLGTDAVADSSGRTTATPIRVRGLTVPGATKGGKGSNCVVSYNPFIDYSAIQRQKYGNEFSAPSFIALAHELVHAWHAVAGAKKLGLVDGGLALEEEAFTVGAGKYEGARVSENKIRAEHGLPRREFYGSEGDCGWARR